jgi:hypothetical protein
MKFLMKTCFVIAIFSMVSLMTSCSEEDTLVSVEDFVGQAVFNLESQGKIGPHGCYDFVFPITIDFPDESTVEVEDYKSLRETLRTWREANPDVEIRPTLGFPLDVTSQDGEVITVADREELHELRKACRRDFHDGKWRRGHGIRNACFKPVFPLTIEFPNGSLLEASTPLTLKSAIRAWRRTVDNPTSRPVLVFPITVIYEDGTQVEVESKEALKTLKDECDESE